MTEPDPFPEEWALGIESWTFHRQFYTRVGRPAEFREYTAILWQIIKHGAVRLAPHHYRVTLRDGSEIVVRALTRYGSRRLYGVEAADWTKPERPGPPPKPLRPTTLTLGNPVAAKALADRLQRMGVSSHAINRRMSA